MQRQPSPSPPAHHGGVGSGGLHATHHHRRRHVASNAPAAFAPQASGSNTVGASAPSQRSTFFEAMTQVDRDPVFAHCLTTSHPDSVLRRVGILRQEGMYKGHHVYFNPKNCLWQRIDDDKVVMPPAFPYHVDDRFDISPKGVIQIFGDDGILFDDAVGSDQHPENGSNLNSSSMGPGQTSSPNVLQGSSDFGSGAAAAGNHSSTAAKKPADGLLDLAAHERNLRMMAEYHNNMVNPTDDALDGTGEVRLDPAHQRSYIRQYLSRAIPSAAQSVRAAIVLTNGSSAVAEQVGIGLSGLQKLSRTHVSATTNEVDALAVSAFRKEILPLRAGITHHVVLRRSMVSRMPTDASLPVNTCRGWMSLPVNGEEDATAVAEPQDAGTSAIENDDVVECVFCGQLKEWHAPYAVCREHRQSMKRHIEAVQQQQQAAAEEPVAAGAVHFPSESEDQKKHSCSLRNVVPLISEEPSALELDQYVGRLVDQLAVGCRQELVIPGRLGSQDGRRFEFLFSTKPLRTVPDRPQIPVVVVLIGGEHNSARRYLARCIARRYTILVVEGSGGYADYLGNIKRRILKAFPFAGRDGVARYSTALDPLTSEILSNYDLVKFIRRGAKNEELVREIDGALKGEGVLAEVWRMYAKIHANAKHQSRLFFATNLVLMLMSLFVTFLTALQTYLLLQIVKAGDDVPPTFPDSADERGSGFLWRWTLMQWSIILLPILISATQAYGAKADYGAKWIALRTTAHRLLSEIYQYRTSCLLYYEGEVERHKAMHAHGTGEDGGAAGGGGVGGTGQLVYKSKEDLLQKRAMELDAQTREGACKQLTLFDKVPSVPPRNILEVDDGFSALTPDQYVRVRLRRMVEVFERDAHHFTKLVRWCQNGITLANGVGTALAAMAAFTDGTIQAWLAFTTALVATLLRALEGFRLEFQVRKKVQSSRMLQSIGAWWGSMREKADNSQNRDWLVEQVETVILEEVDAWAQQFGQALETMKRGSRGGGGGDSEGGTDDEKGGGGSDDDDGDDGNGVGGADGTGRNTYKSLELTELSAHSLGKALSDPTAPQKLKDQTIAKIRSLKQKLLEQNGGSSAVPKTSKARREAELAKICEKAKKDNQDLQDGRTRRGDAVSIMDQMQFTTLAEADKLPEALNTLVVTRSLRFADGLPGGALSPVERTPAHHRRLSANSQRRVGQEALAHAKNISFFESLEALRRFPDFAPHLDGLPHRHVLEVCKRLVCENLLDEVKTRLPRARLRELCGKETSTEEVVSQLLSIALTPRIESFSMSAVLMLIRDVTFRNNLALLPDCEVFFGELVSACIDVFNADAVNFALFNRYCAMIAELDVDLLMHDMECCVALARSVENLIRYGIRPWVLQKGDLLEVFPDSVRSVVSSRSHVQLAAYLDEVLASKPSLTSVDHLLRKYGRELFPHALFEFLTARREHQILFASIAESLTQSDILLKPMNHLVRMMDRTHAMRVDQAPTAGDNANGGADAEASRELHERIQRLPPANLRLAFSILQTIHSNGYGASIVDRACDSIVDFSLREVLNYENVVRLVAKLSELKVTFLECCPTKSHVLQLFGFRRLAESLDNLSDAQLKEIFFAFQFANATDWTILQAGATLRTIMEEEITKLELVPMQRISKRKRPGLAAAGHGRGGALPDRDDDDDEHGDEPHNVYDEEWVREMLTWTGKTILRLVWASGVTSADRLSDESSNGEDRAAAAGGFQDEPLTARTIHRKLEETLLDAPDYLVMKALKPFHPAVAREILRRLQPLGVEADVSRLFGLVISQGGYNRKQLERMEMALAGWETRQALVDALGTMLVDDSFDVFEATPDVFVDKLESTAMQIERCFAISDCDQVLPPGKPQDPTVWSVARPPLREAFTHLRSIVPQDATVKESRTLQDAFTNILTELRHSSPLLVFYRLAALCHFVDIRELFSTVEIRTDLVTLLTVIVLDEDVLFNAADADITRKALAASAVVEASPDDVEREATFLASPSSIVDDATDESSFKLFSHKIFSDFSTIDCRLMGLGSGHDTDILPKGYWHKRVLTAVHLRYERRAEDNHGAGGGAYEYEEVISVLHELSEPALRHLLECHAKVLQSTIGRFFKKLVSYKRPGGRERRLFPILEDLSLRQSFIFDIAMSNLVRSVKVFPHEMSISLDHLEVDKFSSRSEVDRRAVLGVWMSAGSQGPLDVLIKASTVPAGFSQDPLAQTLRKKLQQPGAAAKDPSMAMFQDGSFSGRVEEMRMRRKFIKYVFDMIDFAKPDDEKNALEQSSYIYESRLSQIMTGHKSLRAVTTAHAFVTSLKQSVEGRIQRQLPPRRPSDAPPASAAHRQQGSVHFDARSDEETALSTHPTATTTLQQSGLRNEPQGLGVGSGDDEELGIEAPAVGSSESMPSAAMSVGSPAKSRSSGGPRIRRLRTHAHRSVDELPPSTRGEEDEQEESATTIPPLPAYGHGAGEAPPPPALPHPMTATYSLSALTATGDEDHLDDAVEIGLE